MSPQLEKINPNTLSVVLAGDIYWVCCKLPSFRELQQGRSHFSFRFRYSRIEIRPDINNLIKKITTIKRPCECGTWSITHALNPTGMPHNAF